MEAETVIARAIAIALALALAGTGAVAQPGGDETVRIVLKFVKRGDGPGVRFDPASCAACTPIDTPLWNADNARETVVALTIPRRRTIELDFVGTADAVRRVILEGGDVPFRAERGRIVVSLPPVATDAITAAEGATHIVEPGMVLRFEHADPARRAGAYATGPFPVVQRRAADVLEFAQREVVRRTGLGERVARGGLGTIQIMGFDTHAPHAHVDAPPHMHMHLRWPRNAGTQIGHYYIGADGLLTHNLVGISGLGAPERRFGRGETFTTLGPDGVAVYTHRVTPQGWLETGRAGEPPCLIRPAGGAAGFADGAEVTCPGTAPVRLGVTDDRATGRIIVTTGAIVETFRYDPHTGALLSPVAPSPPGPSVYVRQP